MTAQDYHERQQAVKGVLHSLRRGARIVAYTWQTENPGSRLAPIIEKLRNAHGFDVQGQGKAESPYWMPTPEQWPTLIETTAEVKQAYWNSLHWRETSNQRMQRDEYRCVLCKNASDLEVHHICYNLFAERLEELMTLCRDCHAFVHVHSRVSFPRGIDVDVAMRLGIALPEIEKWLQPLPTKQASLFA